MREHPIIFSGPMVRAILEGKKTQTRRVVTQRNSVPRDTWLWDRLDWTDSAPVKTFADDGYLHVACAPHPSEPRDDVGLWTRQRVYPQWDVGDRLWVRETFGLNEYGGPVYVGDPGQETARKVVPSIHMPRWACRILLDVTEVRVQRVQDISEEDSVAEGCVLNRYRSGYEPGTIETAKIAYRRLWDSINAKRGFGWEVNPWVWAVTFKRVDSAHVSRLRRNSKDAKERDANE